MMEVVMGNKVKTKIIALIMAVAMAAVLSGCASVNVNVNTKESKETSDQAKADDTTQAEDKKETAATEEASEENEIFTITMPEELDGTYIIKSSKNGYSVYDKEANEAGFGGFVFSVDAYATPDEYAGGMDMKVGEIVKGDEVLYDVVRQYPSEVSYDYEKYPDEPPKTYDALADAADDIIATVKPTGEGEYVPGKGCKGEDMYGDVIKKFVTAIDEKWDSNKLENEQMSPEYYAIGVSSDHAADNIGYAFFDVNNDGIDEFLVGEIIDGDAKGTVYDIYTMVERKPAHVISGSARDRYYALTHGLIVNEGSGGADLTEWQSYDIEPNTTNLMPQLGVKMDGYENKDDPWFVNYGTENEWKNITEEEFDEYKSRFEYVRFDFTPFSKADVSK